MTGSRHHQHPRGTARPASLLQGPLGRGAHVCARLGQPSGHPPEPAHKPVPRLATASTTPRRAGPSSQAGGVMETAFPGGPAHGPRGTPPGARASASPCSIAASTPAFPTSLPISSSISAKSTRTPVPASPSPCDSAPRPDRPMAPGPLRPPRPPQAQSGVAPSPTLSISRFCNGGPTPALAGAGDSTLATQCSGGQPGGLLS